MDLMHNLLQGEIWLFDPEPTIGTEIGKKVRPCMIVSNNSRNKIRSGLVIIIPLTSVNKNIISHIKIDPPEGGLKETSYAVCEQIRSISRERLKKRMGIVRSRAIMQDIFTWIIDLTRID